MPIDRYFISVPTFLNINSFFKPDKDSLSLSKEESHYASRVLRVQIGEEVNCFDGYGLLQKAKILSNNPKEVKLEILETLRVSSERNKNIHIAIAPTKQMERLEWFVEKSVEIGIDEISFVLSRNSVRSVVKKERIERTILSAARQSGNYIFPRMNGPIPLNDFIKGSKSDSLRYIAHLNEGNQKTVKDIRNTAKEYLILIGPEGDFTPEETQIALKNGFMALSLGNSRLRTETAGIAACLILNNLLND